MNRKDKLICQIMLWIAKYLASKTEMSEELQASMNTIGSELSLSDLSY